EATYNREPQFPVGRLLHKRTAVGCIRRRRNCTVAKYSMNSKPVASVKDEGMDRMFCVRCPRLQIAAVNSQQAAGCGQPQRRSVILDAPVNRVARQTVIGRER